MDSTLVISHPYSGGAYKARLDEMDDMFHTVIQWDPEWETIAHGLNEERRVSGPRRQVTHLNPLAQSNRVDGLYSV